MAARSGLRRPARGVHIAAAAVLALAVAGLAGPARAGLEICNSSELQQTVAIGYKGEAEWMSEGWWSLAPGACATVVAGDLKKRYYYYYAEIPGRVFDSQDFVFCTRDDAFTIAGDKDCEARGFITRQFREIDTGETAKAYTLSLVNPEDGKTPGPGPKPAPLAKLGLDVCNDTEVTRTVSIAYHNDGDWTSEGWWQVEPGTCVTPVTGALKKRYFYYRAEAPGGVFIGENHHFCTSPEAYTIVGDTDCAARGYEAEDFSEVDTGEVAVDYYAIRLTPEALAAAARLELCNDTRDTQTVAISYHTEKGWISEGWWNVEPDSCVTPTLDGRPGRYVYYRAEVNGGDFGGQDFFFCTSPKAFVIEGESDCAARGYDREDFREIDTGGAGEPYTLRLTAEGSALKVAPGKTATPKAAPSAKQRRGE